MDIFGRIRIPQQQHIKADEAEREIRAQIEKAMVYGNSSHAHRQPHGRILFARPDLFAVYLKVAHEYKLPFLAALHTRMPRSELLSLLVRKDMILDNRRHGFSRSSWAIGRTFILTPSKI